MLQRDNETFLKIVTTLLILNIVTSEVLNRFMELFLVEDTLIHIYLLEVLYKLSFAFLSRLHKTEPAANFCLEVLEALTGVYN